MTSRVERKLLKRSVERKEDSDIFHALAGFGDWAAEMSNNEVARYLCDPTSSKDIERWFAEVVFPAMQNQPERSRSLRNVFLKMVDANRFDEIVEDLDDLSPVPFTGDVTIRASFFRQVAELLRDSRFSL